MVAGAAAYASGELGIGIPPVIGVVVAMALVLLLPRPRPPFPRSERRVRRGYARVMPTIILLTEEALRQNDVENIRTLHGEEPLTITVLVPADTERNVVADIIDHLSLFELKEAWHAIVDKETDTEARQEAGAALQQTVAALEGIGATVTGTIVDDDPLPPWSRR